MIVALGILAGFVAGILAFFIGAFGELFAFPWGKRLRTLSKFSLASLLAIISSACVALGIHQLQIEFTPVLRFPFLLNFATCLGMWGAGFAIFQDCQRRIKGTAVESFRQRQREVPIAPPNADPKNTQANAAKRRNRKKWWLRQKPSRIRSLSRNDMQICEGYYIRDD